MIAGISHRDKRYVEVDVRFDIEGGMTPQSITWDDGRSFEIDRVLERRRAASLKVGGRGLRFLVEIGGQKTYLFYEDPAWFVEAKAGEVPTV